MTMPCSQFCLLMTPLADRMHREGTTGLSQYAEAEEKTKEGQGQGKCSGKDDPKDEDQSHNTEDAGPARKRPCNKERAAIKKQEEEASRKNQEEEEPEDIIRKGEA